MPTSMVNRNKSIFVIVLEVFFLSLSLLFLWCGKLQQCCLFFFVCKTTGIGSVERKYFVTFSKMAFSKRLFRLFGSQQDMYRKVKQNLQNLEIDQNNSVTKPWIPSIILRCFSPMYFINDVESRLLLSPPPPLVRNNEQNNWAFGFCWAFIGVKCTPSLTHFMMHGIKAISISKPQ